MSNRYTYDFVKKEFEDREYTLVSKAYTGCYGDLMFVCPKGHKGSMKFTSFKQGCGCKVCAGNVRLTVSFIKEEFKKRGYSLVSTKYINGSQKLEYICPNGHKSSISWDSFKQGHGCAFCYGNSSYDFGVVKDEFKRRDYILLSKKYSGAHGFLDCICPKGHNRKVTWHNFQQGSECRECLGLNRKGIDEVNRKFEAEGYTLLSTEYANASSKLEYACSEGHLGSIDWNGFQQGHRCPKCSRERVSVEQRLSIEHVKSVFMSKGFILLDTAYKNSNSLLKCECPVGHAISKTYVSVKSDKGCGICFRSGASRSEKEVADFVKSVYSGEVLENTRKVIKPFELDIYIPSNKLAIEYNGLYWHSEERGKDKFYHYNKVKLCAEKGIRLITIFEDEFLADKEKVFTKLRSVLNNTNKIFPKYTKTGTLSDLCWDGLTSKGLYIKAGFVFSRDIGPVDYYIENKKNRVRVEGQQVIENANKIWDCGHTLYNRGK